MDFSKLFEDIARAPKSLDIVRMVEEARLDFYEAQELVDAMLTTLRARFYDQDFTDIEYMAKRLKNALQRAQERFR